jgi:arginase family enzyme
MNMAEWLAGSSEGGTAAALDVALVGAPISRASITPSQAWSTPAAFRRALSRFPTWHAEAGVDIAGLRAIDVGDVEGDQADSDAAAAHLRIEVATADAAGSAAVIAVIGGDNSLTRPAFLGVGWARRERQWGLLTLDAHHDCRPVTGGSVNGTPVRELIESGLPGERVAQVGIHPLGNAREHAAWAAAQGVHVHGLVEVRARGVAAVLGDAVAELRAAGADAIYVDLDLDVVDQAAAPACPASLPGGLPAHDLLGAALMLGAQPGVGAVDLCEVDALADVAGITVRLMAAAFTAFCAGVAQRSPRPR